MLSLRVWSWWRREDIWASRSWSMVWRRECSMEWEWGVWFDMVICCVAFGKWKLWCVS